MIDRDGTWRPPPASPVMVPVPPRAWRCVRTKPPLRAWLEPPTPPREHGAALAAHVRTTRLAPASAVRASVRPKRCRRAPLRTRSGSQIPSTCPCPGPRAACRARAGCPRAGSAFTVPEPPCPPSPAPVPGPDRRAGARPQECASKKVPLRRCERTLVAPHGPKRATGRELQIAPATDAWRPACQRTDGA